MNVNFFKMGKAWLLVFLFLIVGVTNAQAEFEITEDLTLNGFIRQTAVLSMGTENSNLTALTGGEGVKPTWNLFRTMVQLELNYQPTDIFRVYMKTRFDYDQTYMWQRHSLDSYNTTPWTYEHHAADLRTGYGEDTLSASIWEVWVNIETDLLWIRLGKQQIAWGDLPGVRIADKINPLDKSWHLTNEPEEYENVRIPEWTARVYFTLPETMSGPFDELFIEGFYNPGDLHPDIQPAPGSPYMNAYSGDPNAMAGGPGGFMNYPTGAPQPDPDFNDMRSEDEYGIRIGCNIENFQGTFIFNSMFNDFPFWTFYGAPIQQTVPGPPGSAGWMNLKVGTDYPEIDVYAMTLSYAFSNPINTSVTFEGSYTPNQPWQSVAGATFGPSNVPAIAEGKYWRTAIYLERNVFWLNSMSRFFFPGKIGFMYYRHWIDEEDRGNVKLTPAAYGTSNRLDWAMDMVYLSYTLPFGPGAMFEVNPKVYWNPEGAYKMQCFLKYQPNYDWRFDLGAMWQGGSCGRAFLPTGNSWNDEIYMRATYMF